MRLFLPIYSRGSTLFLFRCVVHLTFDVQGLVTQLQCLAAQKATGKKGSVLTNVFGGASNNEGLGLFSLSFDWQYVWMVSLSTKC